MQFKWAIMCVFLNLFIVTKFYNVSCNFNPSFLSLSCISCNYDHDEGWMLNGHRWHFKSHYTSELCRYCILFKRVFNRIQWKMWTCKFLNHYCSFLVLYQFPSFKYSLCLELIEYFMQFSPPLNYGYLFLGDDFWTYVWFTQVRDIVYFWPYND